MTRNHTKSEKKMSRRFARRAAVLSGRFVLLRPPRFSLPDVRRRRCRDPPRRVCRQRNIRPTAWTVRRDLDRVCHLGGGLETLSPGFVKGDPRIRMATQELLDIRSVLHCFADGRTDLLNGVICMSFRPRKSCVRVGELRNHLFRRWRQIGFPVHVAVLMANLPALVVAGKG